MYSLGVMSAYNYVRKALDELDTAEEVGMLIQMDNLDLYNLVQGSIVEAAVMIQTAAPAYLIEGRKGVLDEDYSIEMIEPDVPEIRMLQPTLRVVSLKASDSRVIVTGFLPEDSAEARKQLDPYVRGTHDDPKAVTVKMWEEDLHPVIRYYSYSPDKQNKTIEVEYIPYPQIVEQMVDIAARMEYPVLNMIVSLVLESLSQFDAAALYRKKATEYFQR